MKTTSRFYLLKSRINLRQYMLSLLILSFSVSLISGGYYFINSYQDQMFNENFTNVADFSFYRSQTSTTITNELLSSNNYDIVVDILEEEKFSYDFLYRNIQYITDGGAFGIYHSQYGEFFPTYEIYELNFFKSERFSEYFHIIDGTFPQTPDSLLINLEVANQFNLSVGSIWTQYYQAIVELPHENYTSDYSISFIISGTYLPKKPTIDITLTNTEFSVDQYYDLQSEEIISNPYGNKEDHCLMFSTLGDLTDLQIPLHPVQDMYNFWVENDRLYPIPNDFVPHGYISSGLNGLIDRSSLNYRMISFQTERINRKIPKLVLEFRKSYDSDTSLRISIIYGEKMEEYLQDELKAIRFFLYGVIVPIFLCGLYISIFTIKIATQAQEKEFVLLRSRGFSKKKIRLDFLIRSLTIGTISGILSSFGGVAIFKLFKPYFNSLFITSSQNGVLLQIDFVQIFMNFFISIVTMGIASIPSIRWINRKKTYQLLTAYGSDGNNVEEDDSVFRKPTGRFHWSKLKYLRKNYMSKSSLFQPSNYELLEKGIEIDSLDCVKIDFSTYYLRTVPVRNNTVRKANIISVIVGCFWFLFLSLICISSFSFMPSGIPIFLDGFLENRYTLIIFLSFFSPPILTLGLIRILVKENPKRFAKIIKNLAKFFTKDGDFLVALHAIKQKSYYNFILIFSLFCSLFFLTNITMYSSQSYQMMDHNYMVGADINFELSSDKFFGDVATSPITFQNIYERDDQIKEFLNLDNQNCFECSSFINIRQYMRDDSELHLYYTDLQKYLTLITENDKMLVDTQLIESLDLIRDYLSDSLNNYTGMIITTEYQEKYNVGIGDEIEANYYIYNSTFRNLTEIVNRGNVIAIMPVFPGLQSEDQHSVLIDLHLLPRNDGQLEFGREYTNVTDNIFEQKWFVSQLLDIDQKLLDELEDFRLSLREIPDNWFEFSNFQSYAYTYDSIFIPVGERSLLYYSNMIYYDLFILGIILGLSLSVSSTMIQNQNKYSHGVYLSKGFGRKGLNKMIIAEQNIIFIISLIIGLIGGVVPGIATAFIDKKYNYGFSMISKFSLNAHFWELIGFLGGIILVANLIFLIAFYKRKNRTIINFFQ